MGPEAKWGGAQPSAGVGDFAAPPCLTLGGIPLGRSLGKSDGVQENPESRRSSPINLLIAFIMTLITCWTTCFIYLLSPSSLLKVPDLWSPLNLRIIFLNTGFHAWQKQSVSSFLFIFLWCFHHICSLSINACLVVLFLYQYLSLDKFNLVSCAKSMLSLWITFLFRSQELLDLSCWFKDRFPDRRSQNPSYFISHSLDIGQKGSSPLISLLCRQNVFQNISYSVASPSSYSDLGKWN